MVSNAVILHLWNGRTVCQCPSAAYPKILPDIPNVHSTREHYLKLRPLSPANYVALTLLMSYAFIRG